MNLFKINSQRQCCFKQTFYIAISFLEDSKKKDQISRFRKIEIIKFFIKFLSREMLNTREISCIFPPQIFVSSREKESHFPSWLRANNVFLPYFSATSKLRCMLMSWRELINKYVVGAVNHGVARKRRLASHVFTRVLVLHIFLARKPIVILPPPPPVPR